MWCSSLWRTRAIGRPLTTIATTILICVRSFGLVGWRWWLVLHNSLFSQRHSAISVRCLSNHLRIDYFLSKRMHLGIFSEPTSLSLANSNFYDYGTRNRDNFRTPLWASLGVTAIAIKIYIKQPFNYKDTYRSLKGALKLMLTHRAFYSINEFLS